MGKNKLKKFAEMETFHNVFQCGARECVEESPVVAMRGKWHAEYFKNDNPSYWNWVVVVANTP